MVFNSFSIFIKSSNRRRLSEKTGVFILCVTLRGQFEGGGKHCVPHWQEHCVPQALLCCATQCCCVERAIHFCGVLKALAQCASSTIWHKYCVLQALLCATQAVCPRSTTVCHTASPLSSSLSVLQRPDRSNGAERGKDSKEEEATVLKMKYIPR